MRQELSVQVTLFEVVAGHQIGCELKAISGWLDGQRTLISLVASDLRREGLRQTGRRGLPAETVLRCALLKQQRQLSYEEMAFHLEDSASFGAFARLPLAWSPKKSVLQRTISALRPETWEAVNRALIATAGEARSGRGGADRQHGHRGADARAERQRAVMGCRAPDDAAAAPGGGAAGSAGDALA
jgi:IS5 family transposase